VEEKMALEQVLSEYFGFSCQFSFHRLLHAHHLSSGADTIRQLVADVPQLMLCGISVACHIEKLLSSAHMSLNIGITMV
jgi:hypothetical protein